MTKTFSTCEIRTCSFQHLGVQLHIVCKNNKNIVQCKQLLEGGENGREEEYQYITKVWLLWILCVWQVMLEWCSRWGISQTEMPSTIHVLFSHVWLVMLEWCSHWGISNWGALHHPRVQLCLCRLNRNNYEQTRTKPFSWFKVYCIKYKRSIFF